MRQTTVVVIMMMSLTGCQKPWGAVENERVFNRKLSDPAVGLFADARARAKEVTESALVAGYLYRLDITPEEKRMSELLTRVRKRGYEARTEIGEALIVEEERRTRYLDSFDECIGKAHEAHAVLIGIASQMHDSEDRAAALRVCEHYRRVIDLCAAVLHGQRRMSTQLERFLKALRDHSRLPSHTAWAEANAAVHLSREELERMDPEEEAIWQSFAGTVIRTGSFIRLRPEDISGVESPSADQKIL